MAEPGSTPWAKKAIFWATFWFFGHPIRGGHAQGLPQGPKKRGRVKTRTLAQSMRWQADFDLSDADALVVAKDMFKIWSASLGTKKQLCPRLTALGAKLQSIYEDKKKGKGNQEHDRGP